MSKFAFIVVGASTAAFLGSGGYTLVPRQLYDPGCDVKGNISKNSGERIYHVRGQRDYAETRISLMDGEQWFCSEEEARSAGWRRAGR